MADINLVGEHYPAIRDFRLKDLIGFRGDVLSYWANVDQPSFTTDAQGFRHSTLKGRKYSLVDCRQSERYGIVLGPSSMFGSGIAGNENTMPSLLAERFGFPFANAAMPGANSRNLNALLVGLLAAAERPPAVVVLSNGGDIANFCETGFVDPIFGSPNHVQVKGIRESGMKADSQSGFSKLLVFTKLWTSMTASLCKARGIPLVMVHQSTFFEKSEPSAIERHGKLGEPSRIGQKELFANFRRFNRPFFVNRQELAAQLGLPLAGVGLTDRLNFIDEFHLDPDSLKLLSAAVGDAIEPLIAQAKPKAARKKAAAR
jgi:hypothetical protein